VGVVGQRRPVHPRRELGITISAIRGKRDGLARGYLLAGFGSSVAFNVVRVATITPAWGRYAIAAVPPVAAMLALAALMRQVYRLAVEAHLASTPERTPATTPERAARARSGAVSGTPAKRARARAGSKSWARRVPRAPVTPETAEVAFAARLAEGTVPSLRAVRRELHVGTDRARVLRDHLTEMTAART